MFEENKKKIEKKRIMQSGTTLNNGDCSFSSIFNCLFLNENDKDMETKFCNLQRILFAVIKLREKKTLDYINLHNCFATLHKRYFLAEDELTTFCLLVHNRFCVIQRPTNPEEPIMSHPKYFDVCIPNEYPIFIFIQIKHQHFEFLTLHDQAEFTSQDDIIDKDLLDNLISSKKNAQLLINMKQEEPEGFKKIDILRMSVEEATHLRLLPRQQYLYKSTSELNAKKISLLVPYLQSFPLFKVIVPTLFINNGKYTLAYPISQPFKFQYIRPIQLFVILRFFIYVQCSFLIYPIITKDDFFYDKNDEKLLLAFSDFYDEQIKLEENKHFIQSMHSFSVEDMTQFNRIAPSLDCVYQFLLAIKPLVPPFVHTLLDNSANDIQLLEELYLIHF